jgi:excisionase family DNA binding protein
MIETVLTTEEVAKLLKISEATIYRQVEKGFLPGFKIGRQWRFRREDIEIFMKERSSWKQRFQFLLDEFQKKGVENNITEKLINQEISKVRAFKKGK